MPVDTLLQALQEQGLPQYTAPARRRLVDRVEEVIRAREKVLLVQEAQLAGTRTTCLLVVTDRQLIMAQQGVELSVVGVPHRELQLVAVENRFLGAELVVETAEQGYVWRGMTPHERVQLLAETLNRLRAKAPAKGRAPARPRAAARSGGSAAELKQLAALHRKGVLNAAEFASAKKRLLRG